jgi:thiamine biosynthesis protein ThiS
LRIIVNGEEHAASEAATIATLVEQLALRPERLAVELNGRVVRRADWPHTTLHENDRVEIVHFVGGGAKVLSTEC